MKRLDFVILCNASLLLLALTVGCQDMQKQIEQLNQELEQVRSDLNAAQSEAQQAREAAQKYQQENETLSKRAEDLQTTIAELQARLKEAEAKSATEAAGGWVVAPGVAMISISAELLFDPGKAKLRSGAAAKISQIAARIVAEYADRDIYVVGHTDSDPIRKSPWKDNWELSAQRALTVARGLIKAGVSPKRLLAAGCGRYRPRASNATAAGKAKNRRVEIYAVVPASQAK